MFLVLRLLFIYSLLAKLQKKIRRSLAGARDDSHLMRLEVEEAAIRVRIKNLIFSNYSTNSRFFHLIFKKIRVIPRPASAGRGISWELK
jgi:hypothetical protein